MSEVARLMRQIEEEYQSAKNGLQGLAQGISYHQFMTTKTERIETIFSALVEKVRVEEAIKVLDTVEVSI